MKEKNYLFGVDVGGTTIKLGLFTKDGKLLDQWQIDTNTDHQGAGLLPDIAETVTGKMAEKRLRVDGVAGIGLGVPGAVKDSSYVAPCANLNQWGGFNAADALSKLCGLPVRVINDANAAGLGEFWQGGAKGMENAVFITLGTGVGSSVIADGRLIVGAHGAGGEIGHMKINPAETIACGCGGFGCLEQYASATGMVRAANDLLAGTNGASALRRLPKVTCKDVFDCARSGDHLSILLVNRYADTLARGLSIVSCVVNPDVFVLGGGVSAAGAFLIDKVKQAFQLYAFPPTRGTQIKLAELGSDAGIYGAARLIL